MSKRARHRAEREKIVWKYQYHYLQNRWFAYWKPALKRLFN